MQGRKMLKKTCSESKYKGEGRTKKEKEVGEREWNHQSVVLMPEVPIPLVQVEEVIHLNAFLDLCTKSPKKYKKPI